MAVRSAWYINCDNCGDPAEITTFGGATEARALASRQGYTRKKIDGRFVDLCPACTGIEVLTGEKVRDWNYNLGLSPSETWGPEYRQGD